MNNATTLDQNLGHPEPTSGHHLKRRTRNAAFVIALLLTGSVAGVGVSRLTATHTQVTLLTPEPIVDLKAWQSAAIKGSVAEVFGQAFIVQDSSGRALVDLGPEGLDAKIKVGEPLTVQGRFERGMLHAVALTHADNRTETFGPPPPPMGGPRDWLHNLGTR